MKPLRWVFAHEPAILAGVIAGLSVFFSIRYGTHADAALQGTAGGLVLTIFGTLRNFITPAGKTVADNGPGQIAPIADDVTYLKQFVGDAVHNPSGLVGMLEENWKQVAQAMRDLEKRVTGLGHGKPVSPAAPVGTTTTQTLTKPVSEATTPAAEPASQSQAEAQQDALTELATLVPPA